ncbi:hypothetical protein ASG31_17655 [Chryseobacterium sp. Leaf404]|uniref:hypothetical protein n=1 Tax=unclassified Chryseobacterium TaxID=2593645 RepID=UPI0006FCF154|nr:MULTISPECIES: hypothetical protein [unclassified Chryseobacterium]KQT20255.1 hypothetical protein ASG31_17655 [Chryseobacterium sp. Leaf404]
MDLTLQQVVGWAGGTSVIISGVAYLIGQLVINNKSEKFRFKTESKLKTLENQLSEKSSFINNMIDVQKSTYGYSQEKRILAIEEVWQLITQFNFEFPYTISIIYNVLTEDEINDLYKSSKQISEREQLLLELKEMQKSTFFDYYKTLQKKLTYHRPFLGKKLHKSILVANIFYSRLIMFVEKCVINEQLVHWHYDKPTMNLLKDYLSTDEYEFIIKCKENGSLSTTIGLLETKILNNIDEIITGNVATISSIEQAKEFEQLINLGIK